MTSHLPSPLAKGEVSSQQVLAKEVTNGYSWTLVKDSAVPFTTDDPADFFMSTDGPMIQYTVLLEDAPPAGGRGVKALAFLPLPEENPSYS